MFDLVTFNFETGDSSSPYWQEFALIDSIQMNCEALNNALKEYEENSEGTVEYEDIVSDVLNGLGWTWKPFTAGSKIQSIWTVWD